MNMPTVPRLLRLRGNESVTNKFFLTTEALPVRLGMKHVLVSFSLALVAVFAPYMPYRVDDVAMRTAIYLNAPLYAIDGSQPSA